MTSTARVSKVVDSEWLNVTSVRVGPVPAGAGTLDRYITVAADDNMALWVDVHAYHPDCFVFQDEIIWRDNLILGLGSYVHAVSLADRSVVTIDVEQYFGHLDPNGDYLLLASCSRLLRMEPDGSILWKNEILGLDGVVVRESGPKVVRGDGQWDPPGGWRPFAALVADGRPAS